MTEPESKPPVAAAPPRPPRRRLRLFLILTVSAVFIGIVGPIAFYLWASSDATQAVVRRRIIAVLEESTGGRVEIAAFHWHLLNLEADLDGLVLHGREAAGEAPCARVDHANVKLSILGFFSPRILLRELDIEHPAFHLIVYPDGSTNLPQPRKPRKPGKPVIDTLFDLQAGRVSVRQGELDFENRASEFDFQNRFTLLDFDAHNLALLMHYIPASGKNPESYHIETAATDLNLQRAKEKPTVGSMQATLDLTRGAAFLRSLRITSKFPAAKNHGEEEHTVEFSGDLDNFAQPHWQAKTTGELDMRLLDPVLGYPFAPQGIARLDLDSAGERQRVPHRRRHSHRQWLLHRHRRGCHRHDARCTCACRSAPASDRQSRDPPAPGRRNGRRSRSLPMAAAQQLCRCPRAFRHEQRPLDRPRALPTEHSDPESRCDRHPGQRQSDEREFKDVSLDTLMDMVGQPPFQRFGLDTRLNGTADANWVKGDQQTLTVATKVSLNPSALGVTGEVPTAGAVDATYTQKDGAVDLRKLDLHTPASQIDASGRLGAYPLTSPSGMTVDFHSGNLGEFDAVLRDLGLNRNGKIRRIGAAGQACRPGRLSWRMDRLAARSAHCRYRPGPRRSILKCSWRRPF